MAPSEVSEKSCFGSENEASTENSNVPSKELRRSKRVKRKLERFLNNFVLPLFYTGSTSTNKWEDVTQSTATATLPANEENIMAVSKQPSESDVDYRYNTQVPPTAEVCRNAAVVESSAPDARCAVDVLVLVQKHAQQKKNGWNFRKVFAFFYGSSGN